jgi:hypothetical protein
MLVSPPPLNASSTLPIVVAKPLKVPVTGGNAIFDGTDRTWLKLEADDIAFLNTSGTTQLLRFLCYSFRSKGLQHMKALVQKNDQIALITNRPTCRQITLLCFGHIGCFATFSLTDGTPPFDFESQALL